MKLFHDLLDRKHYALLCLMAGAVLFNAFAFFFIAPTYQSTSMLYVVAYVDDSSVSEADLSMGLTLVEDYEEIICSDQILEEVLNVLDLDRSIDSLRDMIAVGSPEDTRILNITVTSTDREEAMDIANELAVAAVGHLSGMSTDNIAQYAKLAETKTGPSYMLFTLVGALAGALVFCDYVIIRYLLDDSIRTADDIEDVFGRTPLAVVPETENILGKINTVR